MLTASKRQNLDAIPTRADRRLLLCLLPHLLFGCAFNAASHSLFPSRRAEIEKQQTRIESRRE